MNVRMLLAAVVVAALAFAGYQAVQMVKPEPKAPELPAPAPPVDIARESTGSAGTQPYEVRAAEQLQPGADAPFERDVARRITVDEVKQRLDRGQKIHFVDTRAEIPDVMIEGAVQVPEDRLEAWAKAVPRNASIVVYCTCANEATAVREVLALQKLGFRNAYALRDGLAAWQSFDLPTQRPVR